jgi:hypothetical protein
MTKSEWESELLSAHAGNVCEGGGNADQEMNQFVKRLTRCGRWWKVQLSRSNEAGVMPMGKGWELPNPIRIVPNNLSPSQVSHQAPQMNLVLLAGADEDLLWRGRKISAVGKWGDEFSRINHQWSSPLWSGRISITENLFSFFLLNIGLGSLRHSRKRAGTGSNAQPSTLSQWQRNYVSVLPILITMSLLSQTIKIKWDLVDELIPLGSSPGDIFHVFPLIVDGLTCSLRSCLQYSQTLRPSSILQIPASRQVQWQITSLVFASITVALLLPPLKVNTVIKGHTELHPVKPVTFILLLLMFCSWRL